MKVDYYLVITRNGVRAVKRRPKQFVGEWVVRLRVDYPTLPPMTEIEVSLPDEGPLAAVDVELDGA